MKPTFFELFAGAGGMSLGLETAGWQCAGHAEIEKFPRAILAHRWPDTPLLGDVTQLTGEQIGPVTLLSGGSPCQDLSVAGKRAGMVDGSGTRSSLFFHQMRLWQECGAPYCLWENVLGAFSSRAGRDFAAVLSAFVGAPVAVPHDGWRSAGVASGPTGVAAWRVLDAQYFGVPQRRRRVFVLGARTGGVDPAEVLALSEGLCRYPAQSREAGEGIAESPTLRAIDLQQVTSRVNRTQPSADGDSVTDGSLTPWDSQSKRIFSEEGIFPPLQAAERSGQQQPAVFTKQQYGRFEDNASVDATLGARDHSSQNTDIVVYPTIQAADADKWGSNQWVAEGKAIVDGLPTTVNAMNGLKSWSTQAAADVTIRSDSAGRPRRLTPLECERLMGWPDGWTNIEKASDSARYKACGNGIASPVAAWIGLRLREALNHDATR